MFSRLGWFAVAFACLGTIGSGRATTIPPSVLPGLGPGKLRTVVDAGQPPWRGIVRVQTEIGMRCTGALVGPTRVLTAAHCLYGRGTGMLVRPASIHVLTGYDHGDYAGHARAVGVEIGERLPSPRPDADWALLTIDTALGTADRVLPIIRQPPAIGTPVMLGGFEQDRAQVLVADVACAVVAEVRAGAATMLRHSCAGTRGVSGAPLLAQAPGLGWGIVGVASAAGIGVAGGDAVPAAMIPAP